jgi:DNA-binding Lrp family transcriptional regulator
MYVGGVWSWWGTDPRITSTEIAAHVGLKRTAVWARVRRWRREGFWDGFEVVVNPRIFGVGQVHVEIPVSGPVQGGALMDDLEHIDGVIWARVCHGISVHGHEGEAVLVAMVAEDAACVERRVRILYRLSPTGTMEGPFHDEAPSCSHPLTPLDWRILAAITANPNAPSTRIAHLVGITLKTFAHHHSMLIEDHAAFYRPKVDWSKLGCVGLGIWCTDAGDRDRVRAELEARYPGSIPMSLVGFEGMVPDWDNSTCFGEMVPSSSPHGVHVLIRDISRIPGVRRVGPETWGPERQYTSWVSHRIAEKLAATPEVAPSLVRQRGGRKKGGPTVSTATEHLGLAVH